AIHAGAARANADASGHRRCRRPRRRWRARDRDRRAARLSALRKPEQRNVVATAITSPRRTLMICVLAAACGVATTVAWHRHREPARIVAALPTLPDLSEAPVALRERLIAAELAAHDRSRARHGV